MSIVTTGNGKIRALLFEPSKSQVIAEKEVTFPDGSTGILLPISNPIKWTAETPVLYHLVVSVNDTYFIAHRVGFRQVEVKDGLIKVNGKRIVLKGANRHEHHPKYGRAVPFEFMKRDLMLMKTHNINAIRTCHQPSDVRLYDLADELGVCLFSLVIVYCVLTHIVLGHG